MKDKILTNIIKTFPFTPGCYLFKDEGGNVLYVGKSKCLRKRVASYFQKHREPEISWSVVPKLLRDDKFVQMMRFVTDVSYQGTETDIEALLLEYQLIKKHRPPYNVKMRKDKQHWYIKIMKYEQQPYPLLSVTSDKCDGCLGDFPRKEQAEETLQVIAEYWRIPICALNRRGGKPCLRFHIGQCMAPCAGIAKAEEYQSAIGEITDFFRGNFAPVLQRLSAQVQDASHALSYEKAAHLHHQYEYLQALSHRLSRIPPNFEGKDYCLLLKSRHEDSFIWFHIQGQCAKAWLRFSSMEEWEEKSGIMLRYIKKGEIHPLIVIEEDSTRLTRAILEIDALRRFVDISHLAPALAQDQAQALSCLSIQSPDFWQQTPQG